LVKKRDDEHTQLLKSSKGINEFIKKTDDEYPDEPTSNVGCSPESPVLARGRGAWELGNLEQNEYSIKVEERL
jgi:hypothetical protein